MTHEQHLYGDQWHAITDSPAAKRRAKSQRPRGSYFEEGTHGQEVPPGKYTYYSTPGERGSQYRPDEDTGFAPETSPEERGLLTEAEGPDDFDAAVLKHGDLELVAEDMRDTMPQWVLEERLLGEINKRTTLVEDEFKQRDWWRGGNLKEGLVAPGVTLEDVTKSGDHLELARRGRRQVQQQKRRANRTPEQLEEHRSSERKRDRARWSKRTPEQRESRNAKKSVRYANLTPEQIEERLTSERKRYKKQRDNMTPEQKEHRKAVENARYANLTPEQKERRNARARERRAAKRGETT